MLALAYEHAVSEMAFIAPAASSKNMFIFYFIYLLQIKLNNLFLTIICDVITCCLKIKVLIVNIYKCVLTPKYSINSVIILISIIS